MAESRRWPAPLTAGSRVRVVAPAGPVDRERLAAGVALLESWGLRVELGASALAVDERLPYLAGNDAVRAADLVAAWTDPEVAAVWAARGGYGSQRVLDLFDWSRLRAVAPKHLVGFSDLTALHGRLGRELGQVTVHGPGMTSAGQLGDGPTVASLRRLLFAAPAAGTVLLEGHALVGGTAEGRLWGGNATLAAAEVGVEPPPTADGVLVVEDVAEPAYRIDRAFTQLRRAGWLDRVRGVLVGDLGVPPPGGWEPVVLDRLGDLGGPVVMDVPVGHGDRNMALPLGAAVRLEAGGSRGVLALS